MKRLDFEDFPRGMSGWDAVWFMFRDCVDSEVYNSVSWSFMPIDELEDELIGHLEEDLSSPEVLYYFSSLKGQVPE